MRYTGYCRTTNPSLADNSYLAAFRGRHFISAWGRLGVTTFNSNFGFPTTKTISIPLRCQRRSKNLPLGGAKVADFRNGAVGVKRQKCIQLQHDMAEPLVEQRRWRCGDMTHRSCASAEPMSKTLIIPESWSWGFEGTLPSRDDASVRSQLGGCHIMPGPRAVPECLSFARSRTQAFGNKSAIGIIGDRVPVRDLGAPTPSGAAQVSFWCMVQLILGDHAVIAAARVKRNSLVSRHMRFRTTPMRRARATVARFFPRRWATRRAQAVSQLGRPWFSITVAAR